MLTNPRFDSHLTCELGLISNILLDIIHFKSSTSKTKFQSASLELVHKHPVPSQLMETESFQLLRPGTMESHRLLNFSHNLHLVHQEILLVLPSKIYLESLTSSHYLLVWDYLVLSYHHLSPGIVSNWSQCIYHSFLPLPIASTAELWK